jgi:hypothetical protein
VAAAAQAIDLFVRHVRGERAQLGIRPEEVFLIVRAVVRTERLVFAIDHGSETAQECVLRIAREQEIPLGTPQHFDHVPAGADEERFEFLDDLAIAAHRSVEPLQVTVDHERQVIEILARRERQARNRLRLVHLAVAEHTPHVPVARRCETAMFEVTHEPRVVDRRDRAEPHRTGWELPEVRHQPWMRIGAEAAAADFLAIIRKLLFAQPPLEERAGVHAGRRVRLKEHEVAAPVGSGGSEKVIESEFEDLRSRRVARDVTAEFPVCLVRTDHHR